MQIDAWLLEHHRRGQHPSTLRFYSWSPPALSLGYHQRHIPPHWHSLTWQGKPIELVRRPTGGRAVLHLGDLTYALVTSGIAGDRTRGYRHLCEFLIQGWRALGVDLHYGQAQRTYIHRADCFDTATDADLVTADGVKLIGSAQLRRGHAILQHGSIRLAPDPELVTYVFGSPFTSFPQSGGMAEMAQQPLALVKMRVMEALTIAAAECFHTNLVEQPLSEAEWQAITAMNPLDIRCNPAISEDS
ncbi:MAG: lipoate--protein ligase family protein [Cyanobacteria bacterium]|nr:lipoate--protein ligase family protein [Cyanobacteriota bacterium]MDW8203013.1 biotin/lipoate A/B protein ligase family protein [Cyanobacteriota bacterium SKYGB_h_bin112]